MNEQIYKCSQSRERVKYVHDSCGIRNLLEKDKSNSVVCLAIFMLLIIVIYITEQSIICSCANSIRKKLFTKELYPKPEIPIIFHSVLKTIIFIAEIHV
jgi:hypothetical protein